MPLFTDMLSREVVINAVPGRIVSLVPSQTELLYDLGLEEEVIGITKFCVHPEQWFRTKTRVGGTKTFNIEKVKALKPDFIIANKEENVQEQIEALTTIAPVWISDIRSLADALHMIEAVSQICQKAERGKLIVEEIKQGFDSLPRSIAGAKKVAYGIWYNPWMWAGGDTFISDLIQHTGWQNILSDIKRYPELNLSLLANYKPDIVLLSSEPYPFKEQHIAEVKKALPAASVLLVDGELFSWYGSRLLQAVSYFKSLITSNP